jgi:hypothetical protein
LRAKKTDRARSQVICYFYGILRHSYPLEIPISKPFALAVDDVLGYFRLEALKKTAN